jgi:putative hydrolase of the HAD superfamily
MSELRVRGNDGGSASTPCAVSFADGDTPGIEPGNGVRTLSHVDPRSEAVRDEIRRFVVLRQNPVTRPYYAICDLDDTLTGIRIGEKVVPNGQAYTQVLSTFYYRMEVFGFPREEVETLQKEIDIALCQQFGFTDKKRFGHSLAETYKAMCERKNKEFDDYTYETFCTLGMTVFNFPFSPLDGALPVLETLFNRFQVIIVTKGEEQQQLKKVVDAGLIPFVDQVITVGHKDDQDWKRLLGTLGIPFSVRRNSWAIGNSMKSDVNPPLRQGFNAIHID